MAAKDRQARSKKKKKEKKKERRNGKVRGGLYETWEGAESRGGGWPDLPGRVEALGRSTLFILL